MNGEVYEIYKPLLAWLYHETMEKHVIYNKVFIGMNRKVYEIYKPLQPWTFTLVLALEDLEEF